MAQLLFYCEELSTRARNLLRPLTTSQGKATVFVTNVQIYKNAMTSRCKEFSLRLVVGDVDGEDFEVLMFFRYVCGFKVV